jgi:molybdopterin converting factor small subunit
MFDEKGRVRRYINIFVNGKDIRFLKKLETKLKENNKVSIVPAVDG